MLRRLVHCEHCNSGEFLAEGACLTRRDAADAPGLPADFFSPAAANAAVHSNVLASSDRLTACSACGKPPPLRQKLQRCARCAQTVYCGRACQARHVRSIAHIDADRGAVDDAQGPVRHQRGSARRGQQGLCRAGPAHRARLDLPRAVADLRAADSRHHPVAGAIHSGRSIGARRLPHHCRRGGRTGGGVQRRGDEIRHHLDPARRAHRLQTDATPAQALLVRWRSARPADGAGKRPGSPGRRN